MPSSLQQIAEWRKLVEQMAALTLRCIAFAYSPIEESEVPTNEEDLANWKAPENDLILTAIAGIKVPTSSLPCVSFSCCVAFF